MQRTTAALAQREYDLLIIGGGAFGAAAARDAALRGLRTVLLERDDFGSGASAECFKMVHGGIRYLQHADIPRLRASCRERSALLRIAPHLVSPLPIAIPTYGHGRSGKAFLGTGARVYDLLTFDRNRGIRDATRMIGNTRLLSRSEILQMFPHLQTPKLSGAVVFEDGQMYNAARLVLAFVKGAEAAGADVCNYAEAIRFLWSGNTVQGARVRDQLTGDEFDVRARLTLNAAGPWADYLQNDAEHFGKPKRLPFSRDAYFIVERVPTSSHGIAIQGLSRDKDALLGRQTRHLFAAPWRDKTLIGVWHKLFPETPDRAWVQPEEIEEWMAEINSVYPTLQLRPDEVSFAHCGLVPFGETATATELSFGKESRLVDHRQTHNVQGLVSLVGIRFTMARVDAARALDLLLKQVERAPAAPASDRIELPGGEIENFAKFESDACRSLPPGVAMKSMQGLVRNHGTHYRAVLEEGSNATVVNIPGTSTLTAEIRYAVSQEMAVHLDDVVMRRTDLAAGSHPGRAALLATAAEMGRLLSWSAERLHREIATTEHTLQRHSAHDSSSRAASDRTAPRATAGDASAAAPNHGAMLAETTVRATA
ncbi:FAD-dependent oxidoreductase [Steroidobacter agaridevorans]|uniref:FAD-dependent oxidoreductase n=1 Tax=Steroidobacter agaridevorans TaxID=2695856 RepID=A0A829YM84_9GAMM|nr:FAD-dependent oxidoreductase [Steroidobacter agaridevorans]GFE83943.1 FAD-dependent oxidoreductase [Steroidobacter agaridevorans]GFE91394.1 FAD-dependent oxidoreductase [Steroidobacter agaridevorans]